MKGANQSFVSLSQIRKTFSRIFEARLCGERRTAMEKEEMSEERKETKERREEGERRTWRLLPTSSEAAAAEEEVGSEIGDGGIGWFRERRLKARVYFAPPWPRLVLSPGGCGCFGGKSGR